MYDQLSIIKWLTHRKEKIALNLCTVLLHRVTCIQLLKVCNKIRQISGGKKLPWRRLEPKIQKLPKKDLCQPETGNTQFHRSLEQMHICRAFAVRDMCCARKLCGLGLRRVCIYGRSVIRNDLEPSVHLRAHMRSADHLGY